MKPLRVALITGLVALIPVLLFGGLWLYDKSKYKAPPARVVTIPDGFEVVGERSDGGSGGTVTRWLALAAPDGVSIEDAATTLLKGMAEAGWEKATAPPECCIMPGALGLMSRGDEWAAFESSSSLSSWTYDHLGLDEIETTERAVVIVVLEYSFWGRSRADLYP